MRMKYSTKERVFIVKEYTKKPNIASVQKAWRSHFKVKTAPSRQAILYNNAKFNKSGAVVHISLSKSLKCQ